MGLLTEDALKGIAAYKYKSGHYTWMDNQMTPFWNWVVELFPMWVAPNLITLMGTFVTVGSTFILCYYSPHMNEEAPRWAYALCAACVFIYQTLDAIDGKQARRTGSSSPLGQLFDHGCDALCTVFNMLSAAASVTMGASWESFFMLSIVAFCFYLAQWEEYHTGTMSSGNGYFGVTEAQLTLVVVHGSTAIFGTWIWEAQPIPFLPLSTREILFTALVLSNIILIFGNFRSVLFTENKLDEEERGNKHVSKVIAFLQLLPVLTVLGVSALWITGPDAEDYANHPFVYLFSLGLCFVLLSSRVIVCHMCKVPCGLQLRVVGPLILMVLNAYAVVLGIATKPFISPFIASVGFALFMTVTYLHYMLHVVFEICSYLKISLLTIPNKNQKQN